MLIYLANYAFFVQIGRLNINIIVNKYHTGNLLQILSKNCKI